MTKKMSFRLAFGGGVSGLQAVAIRPPETLCGKPLALAKIETSSVSKARTSFQIALTVGFLSPRSTSLLPAAPHRDLAVWKISSGLISHLPNASDSTALMRVVTRSGRRSSVS